MRKQAVRTRVHALSETPGQQPLTEHHDFYIKDNVSLEDQFVARELLREALSHLSEEDAACLVLHFVAGERYQEIATRLGLTSEAVRKRVSRALSELRRVYASLDKEAN